jgi:hypothetical protein
LLRAESTTRGGGLVVYTREHTSATRNLEADLPTDLDAASWATSESGRDIALDEDVAVGSANLGTTVGFNTAIVDASGASDGGSDGGAGGAVHCVCCSKY